MIQELCVFGGSRSGGQKDGCENVCVVVKPTDEVLKKYVEDSKVLYEGHEDKIQYAIAGATIGTYTGPGAIALAYFERD